MLLSCLVALLTIGTSTFSHAQTQSESRAEHHFQRASQLDSRRDPRAEQEYLLAIKCNAGVYPEAWSKLAQVLWEQMRFIEAVGALKKSIAQTLRGKSVDEYETRRTHDEKILADLQRAIILQKQIDHKPAPSLNSFLEFLPLAARYARTEKLVEYAEHAIRLYPNSSEAHLLVARYLPAERKDQRTEFLKRAVELDPANPEVHIELAAHYFMPLLNYTESIAESQKALNLSNGENPWAWRMLGYALAASGKKKEAVTAFRNYLRVCKKSERDSNALRLINFLEKEQDSRLSETPLKP